MVAAGLNGFHASLNALTFRFRPVKSRPQDFALKNTHEAIRTAADETHPHLRARPRKRGLNLSEATVNDYDALRDYLKEQKLPEFVLSFEEIEEIIDAALPRAAQRASWWETLRSPQEKMPQREACIEAGYTATRLADGKSVRFAKISNRRPGVRRHP